MAIVIQDELNKINLPPETIEQAIIQIIEALRLAGADAVYLFGSMTEGDTHPDSDIDLAVSGLPPEQYFPVLGQALLISPRPLDLIDLDEDTEFTHYLKEKGKLYRVG